MRWVLSLAAGLVLAGGVAFASHLLLANGVARAPRDIPIVIPPGTAERVRSGAAPATIPRDLAFISGDTLVLRNDDAVDHRVGSLFVQPGATVRIPLSATSQILLCSFHPQGSISLAVRGESNATKMLIPTLVLGIPLGVGLGIATSVASRLGSG